MRSVRGLVGGFARTQCSWLGISLAGVLQGIILTAPTFVRSYLDFLSWGDGSTSTICSSLDNMRFRFIGVGSGYPEGDRVLVPMLPTSAPLRH